MLNRHSQFFGILYFVADMLMVTTAWVLAYYLRFEWGPVPVRYGVPPLSAYLPLTIFVWGIWGLVLRSFGLYRVTRGTPPREVVSRVVQGSSLAFLVFAFFAFLFWEKSYPFSRGVLVYFWFVGVVLLVIERLVLRKVLSALRRRGYNLRHVVIVGAGELAAEVARKVAAHPGLGFVIRGFLAETPEAIGGTIDDVEVVGVYEDLAEILEKNGVDQVLVALPFESMGRLEGILESVGDSTVDIKVIPDVYKFVSLRGGIEEFEGLPVISLLDTPLGGWNELLKRGVDFALSVALLAVLSPVFLAIAIAIRVSSAGPVFYRQERMSLDGRRFRVWKFRTMREDAELTTGPVWAEREDPRRTAVGTWLRRTNLDELPQLLNVVVGEMSLVGPRPERPVFIAQFRKDIPRYMLRHKVRAGMTGWAQVHGLRGNTSVERRVEYDLYYIENWSLLLDVRILLLTLTRGFSDPNAY